MNRLAIRLLLAGAIAPAFGCMTAGTSSLPTLPGITGNDGVSGKEVSLPNRETLDITVKLGGDLERDGFLADAIIQYEKARKLDAKQKVLCRRLAVLYDRVGEESKALVEYQDALTRTPKDVDLINDFGYFHYNRGRWAEGEKQFRAALAINEQHVRARVNLGMVLAQQGRTDEAMQAFMKAGRPAEAKANLAFVLAAQGKKEEAMKNYREALAVEPTLRTAQQGIALLENGGKAPTAAKPTDSAVRQASLRSSACADGKCPTPPIDESPVFIDPAKRMKAN